MVGIVEVISFVWEWVIIYDLEGVEQRTYYQNHERVIQMQEPSFVKQSDLRASSSFC